MVEQGVIADVKNGKLIVNIERHAACGSCKACSMGEGKTMRIEFENTIGAEKGDEVKIELDDSLILKGAILFYFVPLLGLILGIFAGRIFYEAASALFGISTMLITFMAVRRYDAANRERFKPKISKA